MRDVPPDGRRRAKIARRRGAASAHLATSAASRAAMAFRALESSLSSRLSAATRALSSSYDAIASSESASERNARTRTRRWKCRRATNAVRSSWIVEKNASPPVSRAPPPRGLATPRLSRETRFAHRAPPLRASAAAPRGSSRKTRARRRPWRPSRRFSRRWTRRDRTSTRCRGRTPAIPAMRPPPRTSRPCPCRRTSRARVRAFARSRRRWPSASRARVSPRAT